jgi:hypothetical protein
LKVAEIEEQFEKALKEDGLFSPFSIKQFKEEVFENRKEIYDILKEYEELNKTVPSYQEVYLEPKEEKVVVP